MGNDLKINLKFGAGIGYQIEEGRYQGKVRTDEFPNVNEYHQPDGVLYMLNIGIEIAPFSFLSIQPEGRFLRKVTGSLNEFTTGSWVYGGKIIIFDIYAGYYHGVVKYNWLPFTFGGGTAESVDLFLIGYQWRDFFVELIYQKGKGIDEIEIADEWNYGKANSKSFSFLIGYNFSFSIK